MGWVGYVWLVCLRDSLNEFIHIICYFDIGEQAKKNKKKQKSHNLESYCSNVVIPIWIGYIITALLSFGRIVTESI